MSMPAHSFLSAALRGLWGIIFIFSLAMPGPVDPEPPDSENTRADPSSQPALDTIALPDAQAKARPNWGLLGRSDEATGTYRLSAREMARSVSNLEDPSRIVQTLPGAGRLNDWETAIIVRGGSPNQTGYLLDGVPVSKVSHYEGLRNDHGGVGILNLAYAEEITFHNGAFAAHLPDRMSGMVDVRFRDGDTTARKSRLITDVTGVGMAAEGPMSLDGRRGSYAGVFRYSTMDLLIRSGVLDAFGTPRYFNGQARVYAPIGTSALRLNVVGGSENWFNGIGNVAVLDMTGHSLTSGVSWEKREGAGWIRVDGHYQRRSLDMIFRNLTRSQSPGTDSLSQRESATEERFGLSADKAFPLGGRMMVRVGCSENLMIGRFHLENGDEQTYLPEADTTVVFSQSNRLDTRPLSEAAGYAEATWRSESDAWEYYAGYRHFFEEISGQHGFGPRLGLKFRPVPRQAVKAAVGLHTQPHDYVDLSQRPEPERAKLPYTVQMVVGWELYLPAGLLLSLEAYDKEAYRLARRRLVLKDGGYASAYADTGRARSQGGEIYVRKPRGGLIGYSATYNFLHHREINPSGAWSKSQYSVPHSFNSSVELRVMKGLHLSWRYSVASGTPYIPFDSVASMRAGTGVYDPANAYTVSEPYFSRIDLRLEWDWTWRKMGIMAFAEVENVLDRRNYFSRRWNSLDGGEIALQGMGRLPMAGIALNF